MEIRFIIHKISNPNITFWFQISRNYVQCRLYLTERWPWMDPILIRLQVCLNQFLLGSLNELKIGNEMKKIMKDQEKKSLGNGNNYAQDVTLGFNYLVPLRVTGPYFDFFLQNLLPNLRYIVA